MKLRYICSFLTILLLTINLYAQNQHKNQSRGFNANDVYNSHDIDHVNLFNGNLLLNIPIGNTYRVGGSLSYSFNLVYNSNLWSQKEVCLSGANLDYLFSTWTVTNIRVIGDQFTVLRSVEPFHVEPSGVPRNDCFPAQYANPATNAGMGWQLNFGRLYLPQANSSEFHPQTTERSQIVYQSPDGSEHAFFATLHEGETGDSPAYFYSRDGSYLRLKQLSGQDYEVHFPDGVIHKFQPVASSAPASDVEYRVTEMRDRFNNYVNINYAADGWTVNDSVGRSHVVSLSKIGNTEFQKVVTKIELDAFNGGTATYLLNYFERETNRAQPHAPENIQDIGQSNVLTVPYLTEIKLPGVANGGYSIPQDATSNGSTEVLPPAYDFTGEFTSETSPGMIRGIILPTGGAVKWKYSGREVINGTTYGYVYPPGSSSRNYLRFGVGVRERTLTLRDKSYTWKYDPAPETYESAGCTELPFSSNCQGRLLTNTVTRPAVDGNANGDYTKHYFSIYPYSGTNFDTRNLTDWHVVEYGLPINKFHSVSEFLTGKPLFLSSEVYASNGVKKRSTYLRYEVDKYPGRDGYGSEREVNARVAAERTVFHDDGDKYQETSYSDFDGLGHYRTAQYLSNFGYGDLRIEITRYNANSLPLGNGTRYHSGSYAIDPATNNPVNPGSYIPFPDAPWILNTYSRKTAGDFSKRSTTFFEFNENGQLITKRVRKELETANTTYFYRPNDVMTVYQYTPNGNLNREKFFGAEKKNNLSSGTYNENNQSGGVFTAPASEEYAVSYSYPTCGGSQLGVVKAKEFDGLQTASYKNEDYEIDCQTGLVKVSKDSAEVATQYFYDSLGRITDIYNAGNPQLYQGEHTKIEYDDVAVGNITDSPEVVVKRFKQISTGGEEQFDTQEYKYDQLGRISIEKVKMPGNVFSARYTTYNGMGWVTSISEWLDHNLISTSSNQQLVQQELDKKTAFSQFDPFGRAWRTTLPDNKIVQQQYSGIRQVTRINRIRTSATAGQETDATRYERYDQFGRLFQVVEPSSTIGTDVTTNYAYDVNAKLTETSTTSPAGVNQLRTFQHDNLGNLTREQHPEKSVASEYMDYDTLNNVGKSFDGAHWLVYSYDKSTRVTKIEELIGNTPRPFKDFTYYPANVGQNRGLGKLSSAKRHNWIVNPYHPGSTTEFSVEISEDYSYAGVGGRLSKRVTKTNAALATTPTFEQTFTYDAQGKLVSQTYPRCTNANCANSQNNTARPWTANYTYQNGVLQTVGGGFNASTANANYASSVTYNINQTVSTIAHANGVTDTMTIDPKNMSRAANMKATKGTATLWNSGTYLYDGSGNITNIGTDWYLYDKVNRLVEGSAMKISNQRKQRYTYDAFGNQIQIDTYTFATPTGGALLNSFPANSIAATNQYNGIVYDGAGNTLGVQDNQLYTYDAINMMKYAPGYTYLYGPTDERALIADRSNAPGVIETFVLRGLNNEVLREYRMQGGDALNNWSWSKDYIYAGSKLLASESSNGIGVRHYHLDHLGTPRVITNAAGNNITNQHYQYFPFGDDVSLGDGGSASSLSPPEERLKFAGHEYSPDYAGQNLTYMHARFYKPGWGKFLSVDPARDWDLKRPQSLNLYTYTRNNPINNIDPTGRCSAPPGMSPGQVGICVEAFISKWLFGAGDGRGFKLNDPKATSRMQQQIIVDPLRGTVNSLHGKISDSHILGIPAKGYGSITVNSKVNQNQTIDISVSGSGYNGYLLYPFAPKGDITFNYNFQVTGSGKLTLMNGNIDAFPSHHAVAYFHLGAFILPIELWRFQETTPDKLEGPTDVRVPTVGPVSRFD